MTQSEHDAEAQEVGCETIARLIEDSAEPEKVRPVVARLGGITAIVQALGRHSNDFRIPEAGCAVLAKLVEDGQSKICDQLVDGGGVDAVLKAMLLYPGELKVQEAGSAILASVAEDSVERREVVATKGGVHAVMLAMIHHEEVRPVGAKFLALLDKKELDSAGESLRKEK